MPELQPQSANGNGSVPVSSSAAQSGAAVSAPQQQVMAYPAAEPTPVPAGGQQQAASQQAFRLREYVAQQGVNVGDLDDKGVAEAMLSRLVESQRQLQDAQRYWAQQQGQPAQAESVARQPEPEPEKPPLEWRVPEYDPSWEQACDRDAATGRWVAKPWTRPDIAEKLNAYERGVSELQRSLVKDFPGHVNKLIEHAVAKKETELKGYAEMAAQAALLQWQENQQLASRIKQREDQFFARDQSGRFLQNPDGTRQHTPVGQAYNFFLNQAVQMGLPRGECLNYADRQLEWAQATGKVPAPQSTQQSQQSQAAGSPSPSQSTPQAMPAQQPAFGDQNFLTFSAGQMAAQPRTGSFPANGAEGPQNRHETAEELLLRRMREENLLPK